MVCAIVLIVKRSLRAVRGQQDRTARTNIQQDQWKPTESAEGVLLNNPTSIVTSVSVAFVSEDERQAIAQREAAAQAELDAAF